MPIGIGCKRTADHFESNQIPSRKEEPAESATLHANDDNPAGLDTSPVDTESPELTASAPSFDRPVTVAVNYSARKDGDGWRIEAQVSLRILSGHYIYGDLEENTPFEPLRVELILPDGMSRDTEWTYPVPLIQNGHATYVDSVSLTCQLRSSMKSQVPIGAVIRMQACNDEVCFPPATIERRDSVQWK
ncbi:hypothetical protein [Roseiconus nitratireducens]|nr:hypothetical protein [Roseiconus nitratireducens]